MNLISWQSMTMRSWLWKLKTNLKNKDVRNFVAKLKKVKTIYFQNTKTKKYTERLPTCVLMERVKSKPSIKSSLSSKPRAAQRALSMTLTLCLGCFRKLLINSLMRVFPRSTSGNDLNFPRHSCDTLETRCMFLLSQEWRGYYS